VVGLGVSLEVMGRILKIAEQTAHVTGSGDVVVEVGDERHVLADHLRATAVCELQDPFLSLRVDLLAVGAGRQEFDRIVDR